MKTHVWDERYSEPGFAYGTQPNDFLVSVIVHLPPGPVLCLAEGEGRNAAFLASQGFDVTAMDQSAVGLRKAEELAHSQGSRIKTVVADLENYAVEPEAWNTVVAIWCHLPQPLRSRVHRNVVRGLRNGGALVLEAYTPEQLDYRTGGPSNKDLLPSLAELRHDLAGLDLEIAHQTVREIHEGRLHNGMSAVVQVLGFKRGA